MHPVHHHLVKIALDEIKPTQATVGYQEVIAKRKEWADLTEKKRAGLIDTHWFPSIIGPNKQYYIVDHHHLGLALHQEGQQTVLLTVLKDLSWLDLEIFWKVMEFSQWVHPYDAKGNRLDYQSLPKHVSELKDDPYRSLAGLARNKGAYAKEDTPFAEFMWADYFRLHIKAKTIKESMDKAIVLALDCAKKTEASYLPGWSGLKEEK
ncbi:ParB-like protein [Polynucleobacter rarus]|jgi:hypothetical protein|uniref:ParB-like protein n=1 Tax=Polynucleobacter rarus TaxID=556055 RepID=UPI000D3E2099|nr:ParB-like protein [Polynucleobacter rarus]